jgi:hypothetical protein
MAALANTRREQDPSFRTSTAATTDGSTVVFDINEASTSVDRGPDLATALPNPPGLIKERRVKDDGRYIIFYREEGAGPHV